MRGSLAQEQLLLEGQVLDLNPYNGLSLTIVVTFFNLNSSHLGFDFLAHVIVCFPNHKHVYLSPVTLPCLSRKTEQ